MADKRGGRDTAKFKMKPIPGAPPGMETDKFGREIPFSERTEDSRALAEAASKGSEQVKNPDNELEHPGAMPREQQGQGGKIRHHDLEGQQGGTEGGGHEQD